MKKGLSQTAYVLIVILILLAILIIALVFVFRAKGALFEFNWPW